MALSNQDRRVIIEALKYMRNNFQALSMDGFDKIQKAIENVKHVPCGECSGENYLEAIEIYKSDDYICFNCYEKEQV
jgi:formylmethanofuran dehydrogenase subunit E